MTEQFVPQYYRMNSETEEAMFGRDLMDGMIVLIEAPSRRADLDARSIDVTIMQPANEYLPDHIVHQAMRFNRWAKVTRLQTISEEEDKVRQVVFIAEYEDGLRATQKSYMTTGWLVKKDSIPENWTPAGEQKIPKFVKWNGEGIAKKWCELNGMKMVPIDDSEVAKWVDENLTDVTTAASLKTAGYSNVAISQIMRLTEKRVREILDRHAETPFLKEKTNRNLLDDLESGRLRLEVCMEQDGRDVQAIIKPGPNYRPSKEVIFRQFMKENAQFFESKDPIKLPELAQKFNGEFCTSDGCNVSWQLNHGDIRELAQIYWGSYNFETDTFSKYMGFGLTAGQMMARDMVERGDPTKDYIRGVDSRITP